MAAARSKRGAKPRPADGETEVSLADALEVVDLDDGTGHFRGEDRAGERSLYRAAHRIGARGKGPLPEYPSLPAVGNDPGLSAAVRTRRSPAVGGRSASPDPGMDADLEPGSVPDATPGPSPEPGCAPDDQEAVTSPVLHEYHVMGAPQLVGQPELTLEDLIPELRERGVEGEASGVAARQTLQVRRPGARPLWHWLLVGLMGLLVGGGVALLLLLLR